MRDASAPSTRFSATALALGCTNLTSSLAPTPKLSHWMTTPGVRWVMVVLPAPVARLALPLVTTPPWGKASTLVPNASISATDSARGASPTRPRPRLRRDEVGLPALWAVSGTAT